MDSSDCGFLKERNRLFKFFCWTGILSQNNENKTKYCWYMFISRLLWFLIHVSITVVCIWIRVHNSNDNSDCLDSDDKANNTSTKQPELQEATDFFGLSLLNLYLYITCTLVLLLCLGPIQGNIIKRNCETFPKILENITKLENMRIGESELSESENEQPLLQKSDSDLEAGNEEIIEPGKGNCCYKGYFKNVIPKISIGIFVSLTLVFAFLAAYKAHNIDDLWDEYKLFAVIFYLPLPLLTTWFVVTLIKKVTKLYKVILDLKDEMFTDSNNVKKVSEYIGLLQETVEIMISRIISFTVGINLVIFVTSSIICSYEIVQGIKTAKTDDNHLQLSHHFAEVDYFFPLAMCYGAMFWICRVSDRLMSNIHVKIRLRIRLLLQKLYLRLRKQDEPFKELEFVYKTLKEWPPQVYVYGGWKVNYQLFSAIILFIFTYSIKFYSFDSNPTKPHCRMV